MKRIKYYIMTLVVFCFVQYSCDEEFLDKTDPTKISSEFFYNNEAEITQGINGVYSLLQEIIKEQYVFNEIPSDNTTVDFDPDNRGSANRIEAFEFFTLNAGVVDIDYMYKKYYNTLFNANYILKVLDGIEISEDAKNEFKGQLKFIRAYLYYELTQYFGDVILLTEPLDGPSQAWSYLREPQEDVYVQIQKDLNEAISELPVTYDDDNIGRVTKGAALTLLGRILLTQKKYDEATEILKEVLSLGYALLPSYADVFDPANKNSVESVFEIQYQGGNELGEWSSFIYYFAPRLSGGAVTGWSQSNPSGYNIPTKDLISDYEEGDLRKDASIGLDFISPVTEEVVPYIKKYDHDHAIYGRTDDNWPVFRYSDVLLMLAESINEQSGPTEEAYSYINLVRQRAGIAPLSGLDQQSFREKVYHERRIELAFENWRWFDLKRIKTPIELTQFMNEYAEKEKADPTVTRQGIPYSSFDYVFEEFEVIFPLSYNELLINDKLSQNTGY